ncbi:ATP-binding protein [Actinomadura barringtoniae]|uniref:ATP-binding protein n=1 Tax=Actinomadura barringtoniae TaxID=1427535 RepID=A0A939PDJ9_9ACTN|nr:ATP-binding protein [Actinomadura barringtoniae]MBO2447719.1 ATP-binding protein [Actinomadura barringtoniae]
MNSSRSGVVDTMTLPAAGTPGAVISEGTLAAAPASAPASINARAGAVTDAGAGVDERAARLFPFDATAERACLSLPAQPPSVATARRFAAERLTHWRLETMADDVCLVVSELVTNAVKEVRGIAAHDEDHPHSPTPLEALVFQMTRAAGALSAGVWDPGAGVPTQCPDDYLATSGRGLVIIAALADDLDVHPCPAGGKSVNARWLLPGAPEPEVES